ncbi:hypothetical protein Barb6_02788 [Bacteroidales bacterium Barb6]|nr:hypothetical protein Barb6_02788 [Bacteroidales bacterium Barb6]
MLPVNSPDEALMTVLPMLTAVTTPASSTVATALLLDFQMIVSYSASSGASINKGARSNVSVTPNHVPIRVKSMCSKPLPGSTGSSVPVVSSILKL